MRRVHEWWGTMETHQKGDPFGMSDFAINAAVENRYIYRPRGDITASRAYNDRISCGRIWKSPYPVGKIAASVMVEIHMCERPTLMNEGAQVYVLKKDAIWK